MSRAVFSDNGAQRQSFDCHMCGHCCEGKGGIVVSRKDLARLCAHLGVGECVFTERYGEEKGGKLFIRAEDGGCCIFFQKGKGCGVHEAKPDICRAWPYFRGNLVDSESFALAKGFCPGIAPEQEHGDFVSDGLAYLESEGLTGSAGPDEAGALQIADLLANRRK